MHDCTLLARDSNTVALVAHCHCHIPSLGHPKSAKGGDQLQSLLYKFHVYVRAPQGLFTTKLVHKQDSLVSINRQHELYTAPPASWLGSTEQARVSRISPLLFLCLKL